MFKSFVAEIKNRILLSLFSWFCCMIASYIYKDNILYLITKPNLNSFNNKNFYFIFTNLSEPFYTCLELTIFVSNQLTYIFFIYQIVTFIAPGLYFFEYEKLKRVSWSILVCISLSVTIMYKLVLPWSWGFFLEIQSQQKIIFYFEAKLSEYLDFVLVLYYISVIYVLVLVTIVNIIMYNDNIIISLRKYRKLIYFFIIMSSSIITPPDVLSQLTASFIFACVFEVTFYLCFIKNKIMKILW